MPVIQKFFLALTLGALRSQRMLCGVTRGERRYGYIRSHPSFHLSRLQLASPESLHLCGERGLCDYKRKCWEGFFHACLSRSLHPPISLVSHAQGRIPTCTPSSRITSTDSVEPRSATYRQRVIGFVSLRSPARRINRFALFYTRKDSWDDYLDDPAIDLAADI
ncbi:hypothetical protein B0H65DRAFT_509047 [Neurospora tetraspora]|uniref:Secreted protein n=1 Tax=Neurospora tetraspora TaxID=94610 RepID=A0AAE0MRT5_9PEZI|nr:hypothetical protein B0H65DRAFT_509047 [Neurospora tetraspora]